MMEILKREQRLILDEFGAFTLVNRPDLSFIILTKDIPKNKSSLWSFKNWNECFYFWSDKYLENYYEGWWSEFEDVDEVTISTEWPKKNFKNLYRGNPSNDGFIYHKNGNPLVRKMRCEFWQSYYEDVDGLQKELEKHKKWSKIEIERTPGYNLEICGPCKIIAFYLPTQQELNKWLARKIPSPAAGIDGSYGILHDMAYIKKFRNEQK